MRQLIVLAVFAGCCAANAAEEMSSGTLKPAPNIPSALTPSQVFDRVKDSVVVVKTFNAKGVNTTLGSGVLLPSGKIGTNCHVVKNGATFQVGGGKHFISATLWGGDEDKDICLLEARGLTAKPAQLGQATRLKVGEAVYAVGAPQGLELSLSNGIVSQLRGGPPPFIQTTAAISHGSSGGGLFDEEGRLVGFTTLYIEGGQSLNFAMPVEWVGEIQIGKKAAHGRSEGDWKKRAFALDTAQNWTGLRNWCQQWTQEQPRNADAWDTLAFAYLMLQRDTDAIEAYREALRINPENTWWAWQNLGLSYSKLQLNTEAIEAYHQALRINPEEAPVWSNLGKTYRKLQRYDEAIEAYHQALRINSEDADTWYNLGVTYRKLQRDTEAIDAYRQALRVNPEYIEVWNNLGNAYADLRRYTEATEALRQALRINPKYATAWYNLGITYSQAGNHTAALESVQQLRRLDPTEADELFNLIAPR